MIGGAVLHHHLPHVALDLDGLPVHLDLGFRPQWRAKVAEAGLNGWFPITPLPPAGDQGMADNPHAWRTI